MKIAGPMVDNYKMINYELSFCDADKNYFYIANAVAEFSTFNS